MPFLYTLLLAFLSSVAANAINPMKEYRLRPEQFELDYKAVKISTPDGAMLNSWIISPSGQIKATLIIAGSDAGNMGFVLPYVYHLVEQGFQVVTFDYRGFGESSDFEHRPDYLYHSEYITDLASVLEYTKKQLQPSRLGILGFSMGSYLSAVAFTQIPFDFFVAEGFYPAPAKVIERIWEQKGKQLALPDQASPLSDHFYKAQIPMVLIASSEDSTTTLEDSTEFARGYDDRKVIQHQGEHLRGVMEIGMEKYIHLIVQLAEKPGK
jgi:hypothetical protein